MLHAGLLRDPKPVGTADVVDWSARFTALRQSARDSRLHAFYAAGAVSGDTPLQDVPLLALDVETTGLNPATDGIVSVGLVPMSLDRIRASQGRHWLLKPRVPLVDEAITFHGITHQQLRQAPDLDDVLGELLSVMAGQVMVVHCRDIERQFLDQGLRRRLGEGIEFPVIDTMELEARLHRRPPPPWWRRLWRSKPPPQVSIRLAASRMRYGLPRYRLHHALSDALASAELLQAQVAHRFGPQTPLRDLWH
ncbi:DNA polymerase-3 subunit epsilon [Hydrogenophaga palleronii]|uniref:DNA polymerase-3 subunit epsilon n=1 Tax=Hydrogenophaga palleronii TaxID=65655 RepID=A0ABU1WR41_9BURK|nr:3'-5' exonuclease [Hydrogenophaga palleronii]MDR7151770.1 DNA polymerase-3 subunit epsilon [Hydrogenophaga palleronii]